MAKDVLETRARRTLTSVLVHWRLFNLSLAAKCRVLFGLAVLLIIAVALSVPWYRMEGLVEQRNGMRAEAIADAFLIFDVHRAQALSYDQLRYYFSSDIERSYPRPTLIKLAGRNSKQPAGLDTFARKAIHRFERDPNARQDWHTEKFAENRRVYRYLQAVRVRHACLECHGSVVPGEEYRLGQLVGVVDLSLPTDPTDHQLLWNRAAIAAAVTLATLCALAVFYAITHWLILAPIDQLRRVAENVTSGQVNTRVSIQTGDEFEELAGALNQMLDHVSESQRKLQTINKSLDTKLGELAEINVALHEANRLKSEFLANVTHELRTPLNSIIGFAELMQGRPEFKEDAKFQRYVTNILNSARSLLGMINELLDLAKIEAGRMELRLEKLVVRDLCENLYNFTKPLADQKHLQYELNLEDDLPVMETDAGKLQQIMYNLLANAIKFTPDGGQIILRAQSVAPEHVRMSVSDTGPGIPKDQQEAIFEKFRQIDSSAAREHGGAGLGLAIAKELAAMLGGKISVASEPGHGATFSVTLPQKAPSREAKMPLVSL